MSVFEHPPIQHISDDENEPGPSKMPRRGTRACDRCRKIKSKCEGAEDNRCKNCVSAGTACTFQGPSFKRGPPKGYIHAIEQRWHQVECILATLMILPKAHDIVAEIRQDPFARGILDRVESGPYGSLGRATSIAPGQDGFYNTIMNQSAPTEDRRSKRQSRQTREFVSSQDASSSAIPTAEWQEQLLRRLAGTGSLSSVASPAAYSTSSSDRARLPSYSSSSGATSPVSVVSNMPGYGGPDRRRRRIEAPLTSAAMQASQPTRASHTVHDTPPKEEEYDEAIDAFGHLSVDQNQEFRYHGRSAGLHLLAKSGRTDDSEQAENGIWKFNMPRLESECRCLSFDQVNERIQLPDVKVQDQLITLYFTYVHHFLPILHKPSFLTLYYERRSANYRAFRPHSTKREPMQTVTKLLLLAMFAFAARYAPVAGVQLGSGDMEDEKYRMEAGNEFALDARKLLNTMYEDSKPSICQALLLLGLREFGISSMAQGWIYIGMGCRMAIDLGMNRDADKWKDAKGNDIYTPIEKHIRRQIWWSCCIADKLSAVWLGRPVMYRMGDHSTPEPELDMNEDQELWLPYPRDALGPDFHAMPAHVMTCFRAQCGLSQMISDIMVKLYPVKNFDDTPRRVYLDEFETRLHQWFLNLPAALQFQEGVNRPSAPPHVILLQIEYHSANLLLHRAFLPNWKDRQQENTDQDHDILHSRCLDICSASASKITTLINTYDTLFGLQRAPPMTTIFLQSAGIMHVVTLTRRPRDTQATIGLIQAMQACDALREIWPEAIRIKSLLKGAKVQLDDLAALSHTADRPKRGLDEAFGTDRSSDLLTPSLYGLSPFSPANTSSTSSTLASSSPFPVSYASPNPNAPTNPNLNAALSTMSYIPGYEWWPQLIGPGNAGNSAPYAEQFGYGPQAAMAPAPQGLFTFDQSQLADEFMQNVGGASPAMAGPSGQSQQNPPPPHSGTPNLSSQLHGYGQGYPR